MPTEEERREVARRLREDAANEELRKQVFVDEVIVGCIGETMYNEWGNVREVEILNRLADLIEPCENVKCVAEIKTDGERLEQLVNDAVVEVTGIDRERLLAIATMIAADSVRSAKQGSSVSPVYILHAARNIAEACGETFGSIRNRELAEWGTSIVPKETIVDRDALLEIADELETFAETEYCAEKISEPACNRIGRFAERIREACGVEA